MSLRLCVLILLWITTFNIANANEARLAKVIAVLDGDTVLLKRVDGLGEAPLFYKLRLADIDAPEKDQDSGESAKAALARLVLRQQVYVTTVATDSYGREIGWIATKPDDAIEDTINSEMVRRGWAWALSRSRSSGLREMQQDAQRNGRGLWARDDATPPWIWRKQKRLLESNQ